MIDQIVRDLKFKDVMERNIKNLIAYLFDNNVHFSVVCNIKMTEFDPELPDDIYSKFKPLTLFALAGYTFDSAFIDNENNLCFEAGFGADNFGSFVKVPLFAILQVVLEDSVIAINLTAGTEEFKESAINENSDEGLKKSMSALLANPENKKFLKNKKVN
ncbi:MAG: hypothetical protein HXX81_01250 [Campylobacterales bacterium]|nr:hypothetical protein [Campylobacterales bacterium]